MTDTRTSLTDNEMESTSPLTGNLGVDPEGALTDGDTTDGTDSDSTDSSDADTTDSSDTTDTTDGTDSDSTDATA